MSLFKPSVPDDLAGHTICVTGHGGYVGRHMVAALVAAGHRPFLIGRAKVNQTPVDGADMAAPWSDAQALSEQLSLLADPVVLNIAGHFVSQHTAADIPALVAGNLEYPLSIFEAAAQAGHARVVNIGTSWEYSDTGIATPANLYAQLKASNAQAMDYFARTRGLSGVHLKLNDTFGGHDTRGKVMGALRAAWLDRREMTLRSWAQPINLLHIVDVVEGILAAAVRTRDLPQGVTETAFLLHTDTVTLGGVADRLRIIAPELSVRFEDMQPTNPTLRGVWTAAPSLTGWASRLSLDDGLRDYFTQRDTP